MIGNAVVLEVGEAVTCADIDFPEPLFRKSENLKGAVIDYDGIIKNGLEFLCTAPASCRADIGVDLCRLLVYRCVLCCEPLPRNDAPLQNSLRLHVPGELRFHAGQPFLIEGLSLG